MAKQVETTAVEANEATVSEQKAMKKATIIQAVKAIAVLVCICLVCGALLALCYDVFYISDEERFNRSMQKIYPELDPSKVEKVALVDSAKADPKYGEVKSVVTDGKVYIIEALGTGGYPNGTGTVTLYVIVNIADAKIVSWVVKENVGQSYIDKVPSTAGKTWYVGKEVSNEMALEMTGATVVATSTAINNAVNMAAAYARNKAALGLGQNPLADAQEAILALLGTEYAAYNLQNASMLSSTIDGTATVKDTFKVGDNEISYIMYADGDKGLVKAYVYGQDAATQKIVAFANGEAKLSANLTETDDLVTKVTELNGKLSVIKSGSYTSFGYIVGIDTANGTVYSVSGIQLSTVPKTYVLGVTISTDGGHGKVTAIELKTDGYVGGGPSKDNTNKLVTSLVGTTLASIDNDYNSNKVGGATQSANLIRIAVETALRDYDAKLASND